MGQDGDGGSVQDFALACYRFAAVPVGAYLPIE